MFTLYYKTLPVGCLDQFNFPNKENIRLPKTISLLSEKVVRSGLKQPHVKELMEKMKINKDDKETLLKVFGRFCITDPFELKFEK